MCFSRKICVSLNVTYFRTLPIEVAIICTNSLMVCCDSFFFIRACNGSLIKLNRPARTQRLCEFRHPRLEIGKPFLCHSVDYEFISIHSTYVLSLFVSFVTFVTLLISKQTIMSNMLILLYMTFDLK